MKTTDLDKKFDQGKEDILDAFDLGNGQRINHEQKRVNVDFPKWMVHSLDQESNRLGVTRQSLIKMWIADRLKVLG
ncbi:MAG: type II toxin-antitoxin system BrnA family antitoxin [Bacteroidota bacterium]